MYKKRMLILIKIIHSIVWLFFNGVLIYLFYAGITNRIDGWVWAGLGCFVLEGAVLLLFKNYCPLTLVARKYSDSTKDNFDIYLPEWLARYNKTIYSGLLGIAILLLAYRLVSNA